jgi:hypothetical protein
MDCGANPESSNRSRGRSNYRLRAGARPTSLFGCRGLISNKVNDILPILGLKSSSMLRVSARLLYQSGVALSSTILHGSIEHGSDAIELLETLHETKTGVKDSGTNGEADTIQLVHRVDNTHFSNS